MLKFDINKLSDPELKHVVAERCKLHGDVSEVMICDPTPVVNYKLAFVRMADPSCIAQLVSAFHAIIVDSTVVIRLDPIGWMCDAEGVLVRR